MAIPVLVERVLKRIFRDCTNGDPAPNLSELTFRLGYDDTLAVGGFLGVKWGRDSVADELGASNLDVRSLVHVDEIAHQIAPDGAAQMRQPGQIGRCSGCVSIVIHLSSVNSAMPASPPNRP